MEGKCCVCKKPIKWRTVYSRDYGFCSKKCIADNAIKQYGLVKQK